MKLAEIFPPGEFLKEELEARDWSQIDLAEVMGRPVKLVNEIILAKRAITPETAVQLGGALGTGPEFWMNLESQYQLSKVSSHEGEVARKAKLYERFPVREMVKRGWIQTAESIEVLERQFLVYFGIQSVDDAIHFPHSAKASGAESAIQQAWLFAAYKLASRVVTTKSFKPSLLDAALPRLNALMTAPEEVRHVPRLLNECGVRFVVVEPLPASLIDGACFWLADDRPVIAMSTRSDRIDNFWFVLRHEIEHVLRGHGKDGVICDEDIWGPPAESKSEEERLADSAAANFGVSKAEVDGYIARVQPYIFSEQKILNFSARLRVHPGVVLGRLQYRFKDQDPNVWKYLRPLLPRTREFLTQSAPHDGWGTAAVAASGAK